MLASSQFPTPPTHTGCTFTGWDYNNAPITTNITINALYTVNTYTVTFVDGYDGSTISTITVNYGVTLSSPYYPTPPTHTGYSFVSWDIVSPTVTSNLTITATYTATNPYATGDVNMDGVVNTADALMLLRISMGSSKNRCII